MIFTTWVTASDFDTVVFVYKVGIKPSVTGTTPAPRVMNQIAVYDLPFERLHN